MPPNLLTRRNCLFCHIFSIFPAIISCLCSFWRSENEAAFYSIILNKIALSRALSHVGVRLCMLFILCCPFDANAPYISCKQETTTTKNEINQRKKIVSKYTCTHMSRHQRAENCICRWLRMASGKPNDRKTESAPNTHFVPVCQMSYKQARNKS